MAAPTWVAVATPGTGESTSVSVGAPAGVLAGDHQLIFHGVGSGTETVTTPSGCTLVRTVNSTGDTGPFTFRCYHTTTLTGSIAFTKSASAQCQILRTAYRGGTGVESHVGQANGTSTTSAALATATTTLPDSVVVAAVLETGGGQATYTPPAGFTERQDAGILLGGLWVSMSIAEITLASPGTASGSFAASRSDFSTTISVVLAPTLAARGGFLPFFAE